MTTQEKIKYIGKSALLNCGGLKFNVEILDCRESFGRTDFQVKPVSGDGSKWVAQDSLTFSK
ncbi:MAG: hypothetical protein KGL39_31245 [Patescibacteria group bacterium]|nr:hypothetical protein [Patescibacteria group bacterium]